MTEVTVLGDGAWGMAVAMLLAKRPNTRVTIWSAIEETGRLLQRERENASLLPGVKLPESIRLTTDIAVAGTAPLWVSGIPTVYLRSTLLRVKAYRFPGLGVLSLTKGTETGTFLRPSEILEEILQPDRVAVLSGPSHAEEVAHGEPTSVVVAGKDGAFCQRWQELIGSDRFRVYTNSDVVGVELAGALKNVIAIASGIGEGLGFGDNAKAALLTRGLEEMARFGVAMGASPETFRGLAGMGDLITTCCSKHGRNRAVGIELAKGRTIDDILASSAKIAEGVNTARSVHERTSRMGIELPITRQVYAVLYEGRSPKDAVGELLARRSRTESWS